MTEDAAPVMGEPNDPVEPIDGDPGEEPTDEPSEDPAEGLKKALAAERKLRRDQEKRAIAAEQALADKDKPAEEAAIEKARREAREEAMATANERYARLEVKAALAGRVSNLDVALRLVDISAIEVDANGDVDAESVEAEISKLLAEAPELAAKTTRFAGGADQGAKGKSAELSQLTQSDIERMTPEQVVEARKAGRLNKLLGVS